MADQIYATIGIFLIMIIVAMYHYIRGRNAGIYIVLETLKTAEPVVYERFIKGCEWRLKSAKDNSNE